MKFHFFSSNFGFYAIPNTKITTYFPFLDKFYFLHILTAEISLRIAPSPIFSKMVNIIF